MKNKTKKLIAGLGIGLTLAGGGLTMTGCNLTEDQQAKLDSILNKADLLVEAVEDLKDNLSKEEILDEMGNLNERLEGIENSLSREEMIKEVFDLYKLSRNKLLVNKDNVWDNLKITTSCTTNEEYIQTDLNGKFCFYTFSNGKRVVYEENEIRPSRGYFNEVTDFESTEQYSKVANNQINEVFAIYNAFNITIDSVLDCKILENGNYLLVAFGNYGNNIGYAECIFEIEITKDAILVNMDYSTFMNEDDNEQGVGESYVLNINYKYEYGVLTDTEVQEDIDEYIASQDVEDN